MSENEESSNKIECPVCNGIGTVEHKRCNGVGCDYCENGELICNKCNGFGYINSKDDDDVISDEDVETNESGLEKDEDDLEEENEPAND